MKEEKKQVWISKRLIKNNNHGITDNELLGKDCYGGLDISHPMGINSYILFFPNVREGIHAFRSWYWIPEENNKYDKEGVKEYMQLAPNHFVDAKLIVKVISKTLIKYNIKKIGYDRLYYQVFPNDMPEDIALILYPTPFNWALSESVLSIQKAAKNKSLDFNNDKVLMWSLNDLIITKRIKRYGKKVSTLVSFDHGQRLFTAKSIINAFYYYLYDVMMREADLEMDAKITHELPTI